MFSKLNENCFSNFFDDNDLARFSQNTLHKKTGREIIELNIHMYKVSTEMLKISKDQNDRYVKPNIRKINEISQLQCEHVFTRTTSALNTIYKNSDFECSK